MDEPPATTPQIYIPNISEDVWPFIAKISNLRAREQEIQENASLCDRHIITFAGVHNVTFVSPHSLEKDFINYFIEIFGNKNFQVITPTLHTGETSLDILHDDTVRKDLETLVSSHSKVAFTSYSATPQFYELVRHLRKHNPNLVLPESPEEEDAWTVNFYGSKSGIRQLSQQSQAEEPDFKMSEGLISGDIENTAKIAARMYTSNGGVVLKTNKGHAGMGLLIFRPGDLPSDYFSCFEAIMKELKHEAYWSKFAVVIEKYVDPSSIGGGFPNIEFKIAKNGRVNFLYYCGMRMTRDGVFRGVEINNDVLSDKVTAQIMDVGFYIGEQFSSHGYRGYYDVDFIAAKSGNLYVTESNVRRTGGTHVYQATQAIFGKDFLYTTYALSNDGYKLPTSLHLSFTEMCERLKPVLFNKHTKEGLIITSANLLKQNLLGYIIFGKTKSQALRIENQMESLLPKTLSS